ncbi:unnamed protein product, partial [marine sediment metagenome]
DVTNISGGTIYITEYHASPVVETALGVTTEDGVQTIEFIAISTLDAAADGIVIKTSAAGGTFSIDDFSLTQPGCVAEYAPKGIGDATWEDQSGKSLDGTVVGATAIFPDDWHSFYTDYSILGYQALTNQLIIMRDCTGKWSSGQDYGDVWVVDLDTGAVTTGRRVFTKGIAYSNWAKDWNNDLIIAEQTSSTSVTIKRWTEEPQSQAVGSGSEMSMM